MGTRRCFDIVFLWNADSGNYLRDPLIRTKGSLDAEEPNHHFLDSATSVLFQLYTARMRSL